MSELKTFVNCSNHPSVHWSHKQIAAAEYYGKIVDIEFPKVTCSLSNQEMEELADRITETILKQNPDAVMCMGEFVLCFRIVQKLKLKGICVLATCSERRTIEHIAEDGTTRKESVFVFEDFREY